METLSCSLSLAFLAEVTGRGYQREGFSGFLRAITVTERAIARSVYCECPISAATSDSLRSYSVRAIALRLGNSLPYTDANRLLVPRPVRFVARVSFFTLDPVRVWELGVRLFSKLEPQCACVNFSGRGFNNSVKNKWAWFQ